MLQNDKQHTCFENYTDQDYYAVKQTVVLSNQLLLLLVLCGYLAKGEIKR